MRTQPCIFDNLEPVAANTLVVYVRSSWDNVNGWRNDRSETTYGAIMGNLTPLIRGPRDAPGWPFVHVS